jgi:hypothetical protein
MGKIFSLLWSIRAGSEAHPSILLYNGYRQAAGERRQPLYASLAEVTNDWICTYTPSYVLVSYTGTTSRLKNVTL